MILSTVFTVNMTLPCIASAVDFTVYSNELDANTKVYYSENFDTALTSGWSNSENINQTQGSVDGDGYLSLSAPSGESATKVGFTKPDCAAYAVEFDVMFTDKSSGTIALYSGGHLGPTVSFDGSKIKAQTGGSSYVDMYTGASAGKWYNVKIIANGTTSVSGYTTDILSGDMQSTEKSIARNLVNGYVQYVQINATSTPVSINNLRVYKPSPDELAITQSESIKTVSVPSAGMVNKHTYSIAKTNFKGIDLMGYNPVETGTAKDSMEISIVEQRSPAEILMSEENPATIALPEAGSISKQFKVTVKDEYENKTAEFPIKIYKPVIKNIEIENKCEETHKNNFI